MERETRRRLTLSLNGYPSLPSSIFARFPSITHLSLYGDDDDEALIIIPISLLQWNNLTRLTLYGCHITASVIEALSNASARLEELHLKQVRLIGLPPRAAPASSSSLKLVCLDKINTFEAEFFAPLIKASKSLTTLKLICLGFGPLDPLLLLQSISSDTVTEIHMEAVIVSDAALSAVSTCCPNLETLRLVEFFCKCSHSGLGMFAKGCKSLKRLHVVDWWKEGRVDDQVGDGGLVAVAENCPNLEQLVLGGARVSVTELSLGMLGANCVKLERLDLCDGETVGDAELICIAAKFNALKKLWIEHCPVSVRGIQALAHGCPHLVEVMLRECSALTLEGVCLLRASRASLVVDFVKDERVSDVFG